MRVSIYESGTSKDPHSISVKSALDWIKQGRWKDRIEHIHEGDYSANKLKLPAIAFSGIFEGGKKDSDLKSHSGLICLDWDKIDVKEKVNELAQDPFIYSFFISPSGKGIKALVKIPITDHVASFKALEQRYPDIDKACKNVARLCFVSYDPNLYLNERAKTFHEQITDKKNDNTEFFKPVEEGGRNNSILKSAGKLIAKSDLSKQDIYNILWAQNQTFEEPLSEQELNQVFQNALRYDTREFTEETIDDILLDTHVNLLDDIPPPPTCVRIRNFDGGEIRRQRMFTLGNISATTGKQKSKKSMLAGCILAATSSNGIIHQKLIGELPEGKRMSMLFDTEQAKYDTHKLGMRILEAGGSLNDINVWCLREYQPKDRIKIIERALERYGHLTGFMVIDGIADLVDSINDEEQANKIVGKLMKWTSVYNIHIHVVIHQNKDNNFATGHVGSAVLKKSECVIGVEKNLDRPERSTVKCQFMRGAPEWKDFELVIENGILSIDSMQGLAKHYNEIEYNH